MKKLYALAAGLIACTAVPSFAVTPDQEVTCTYWRNVDADGDDTFEENYQVFQPTTHIVCPAKAKAGNWTIKNYQNSGFDLDFQILNTTSTNPMEVNIRYYEGTSYKVSTWRPKNAMNAYYKPVLRSAEKMQIPTGYDNEIYGAFDGTYVNIYTTQSYANYGAFSHAEVLREDDDEIEYRIRMGSGWSGNLWDDNENSEYYKRTRFWNKHQYGYVEFTFVEQKEIIKAPVKIVDAEGAEVVAMDVRFEEEDGQFTMAKLLGSAARIQFNLGQLTDGRGPVNFTNIENKDGFQTLEENGVPATAKFTDANGNEIAGELQVNTPGSYIKKNTGDFWQDNCTVYLNVKVGDKEMYITFDWNLTAPVDDTFETYTATFGTTTGLQMGSMEVKAKFDYPNSVTIANFLNGGVNVRFSLGELEKNVLVSSTGTPVTDENGTITGYVPNDTSVFFDRHAITFFDGESQDYPNLPTYQIPANPDGTVYKNGIFSYPLFGEDAGEAECKFKSAYIYINAGQSRYRIDRNIESDPTKDLHNFRLFVWAEKIGGGSGNYYFSIDRELDAETAGMGTEVVDENAPVEYFNLQGIRVSNPDKGIYIRRQGKNVSKVRL